MSDIGIKIVNIERVYALVDELKAVDRNKAIRGGMIQGAKVFTRLGRKNLRARNDEHTGNLLQSMRWKSARNSLAVYAGFERSYKFQALKGVGNHAHLVDRGTKDRYTKKGYYRGKMPASYFWTDTRNEGGGEAMRSIEKGIINMIENLKMKY
jgi:hypothetical protein